jgi:hypothetical protein
VIHWKRRLGKPTVQAILIVFLPSVSSGCNQSAPPPPQNSEERQKLKNGAAEPKQADGGKYPAVQPDLTKPLNVEEKPVVVPTGPKRGTMEPETKESEANQKSGQVKPKRVDGGKYPAVKQDLTRPLNEEPNPQTVPTGPERKKSDRDRK